MAMVEEGDRDGSGSQLACTFFAKGRNGIKVGTELRESWQDNMRRGFCSRAREQSLCCRTEGTSGDLCPGCVCFYWEEDIPEHSPRANPRLQPVFLILVAA